MYNIVDICMQTKNIPLLWGLYVFATAMASKVFIQELNTFQSYVSLNCIHYATWCRI